MDEYNQGMDPRLKRYFRKIMNSFSLGLIWLMTMAIAGFYFKLAVVADGLQWYNTAFFVFALLSFAGLLLYFYKTWKSR